MSMTWERLGSMLLEETGNTLLMTLPATFFAYLIGLPLGVLLVITRKDGILPKPTLNRIIGMIVNLLRSVPFIILMVMLFPATRAILGRGTGTVSIIIPLTVSAFPYVARMVEGSLLEVDNGVVEAAQAMGSTTFQIVRKVLIPEAMPSLVNGFAICITTILGYTAMAGTAACMITSPWSMISSTRCTVQPVIFTPHACASAAPWIPGKEGSRAGWTLTTRCGNAFRKPAVNMRMYPARATVSAPDFRMASATARS